MKTVEITFALLLFSTCASYQDQLPRSTVNQVIGLIKARNYEKLIKEYLSEDAKIRFVPHSYLSESDISLTKDEILTYWYDNEILSWGIQEGTGYPIESNIKDYFNDLIALDQKKELKISISSRILNNDGSESVYIEYGNDIIVDVLANWEDPFWWKGVKIVFRLEKGSWRIICLVSNYF